MNIRDCELKMDVPWVPMRVVLTWDVDLDIGDLELLYWVTCKRMYVTSGRR